MRSKTATRELPSLGIIDQCQTAGCGRTCCEFAEGNFIVLYPGEVEQAQENGESLTHLEVTPLTHGGHRAICRAGDKSQCDGGYKPLDCASYPLFPTVDDYGHVTVGLKGQKCPLSFASLGAHRAWVVDAWSNLCAARPDVRKWLRAIKLVGYGRVK